MEINCVEDLKKVADEMHDSEFQGKDFYFNAEKKSFGIKSHSPVVLGEDFTLELYNIEKYEPINLDRIESGKGVGGVFDTLKICNSGHKLVFLSQDLKIVLHVSKIEGSFEVARKKSSKGK